MRACTWGRRRTCCAAVSRNWSKTWIAAVFCRIHRSTIVNLSRVRGLKLNEDGEYTVVLESGTSLRLSRRYRKQLQTRLGIRAGEDF